jgi:hypothetical protein
MEKAEIERKKREVAIFLNDIKDIIDYGSGLWVIPRQETQEDLIELGLTVRTQLEEILSLTVKDYCSGPEPDRDRPGVVWTFGKEINGKNVYIKLKIFSVHGTDHVKCLSFHIARQPLSHPLDNLS